MKLWLNSTFIASSLIFAQQASADFLGLYTSLDYWHVQGDYDEQIHQNENRVHDLQTLDWKNKGQAQLAVSFEHPVPFLPNIRLRHVNIDTATKAKQAITDQPVYTADLDNTDYILYYEILDNIVSVDVGLAAKRLSGDVLYDTVNGIQDHLNISETAPMVYGAVGAALPFTGLSAKAEVLATSYSDVKISDVSAELKYNVIDNLFLDVGAKVGYRLLDIQLDDQSGIDNRLKFNGPYLGVEAHF